MPKARFVPLSDELLGYVKTFCVIWAILFVVLFCALSGGRWGFWSGIGVGFLLTIPVFFVVLKCTGVKNYE